MKLGKIGPIRANNPKLFADLSEKVTVRLLGNADQRSLKTIDSSGAKSMVGYLNNLEVCKCIRGKRCINREYTQCRVGKDGDVT